MQGYPKHTTHDSNIEALAHAIGIALITKLILHISLGPLSSLDTHLNLLIRLENGSEGLYRVSAVIRAFLGASACACGTARSALHIRETACPGNSNPNIEVLVTRARMVVVMIFFTG